MRPLHAAVLATALTVTLAAAPHAQSPAEETPDDYAVPGQRLPARLTVRPLLQTYSADSRTPSGTVSTSGYQASVPVTAYVPIGRTWAVGARVAAATGGGDAGEAGGLSDAQVQVSHFRPLGPATFVASLKANLPTGAQRLSLEEYGALVLLTQDVYGFVTPNLGVGPALVPGLTLALALTDDLVVGVGGAYSLRGPFEPLADMPAPYDPGSEVLLTGGLDWRLSPALTASADATLTLYGTDTVDGEGVFAPGARTIATARLRSSAGRRHAELLVRYLGREPSEILSASGSPPGEITSIPDRLLARVSYSTPVGKASVRPWAEVGAFQDAAILPGTKTVLGVGLDAGIPLSSSITLAVYGRARGGDVTGGEGGLGLAVEF